MSTTPNALPQGAPLDLSSLTGAGSGYGQNAPDVGGAAPVDTSAPQAPTASEQAAQVQQYEPADAAAAAARGGYTGPGMKPGLNVTGGGPTTAPPPPHAKLLAMVTALADSLSAAGTSLATHGQRGGAEMVQELEAQRQQSKQSAQAAAQAVTDAKLRNDLTTAQTNQFNFTNHMNLQTAPDQLAQSHMKTVSENLETQQKAQEVFDTTGRVPTGWTADPSTGQVALPGQVKPAAPAGTPGAPAGPSMYDRRGNILLDGLGKELQDEKGNDDSLVTSARQIFNNPASTVEQKQQALIGVQQKAGLNAQVIKNLTEKADLKVKQESAQFAVPKNQADIAKANAEAAAANTSRDKNAFELGQMKREDASLRTPDATGFSSTLTPKEYEKRYDSFTKSKDYQTLSTLKGSYQQFQDTLKNIQATGEMTGAESVVGLFNAIGISATPLAGKGFRINSNTVEEHQEARGMDQAAYQKLLKVKAGDVITPQQMKDYANIAAGVYHNSYVNAADEAHRLGLPVDFLPQGGGKTPDPVTARVFTDVVLHTHPNLSNDKPALRKAISDALNLNGWSL